MIASGNSNLHKRAFIGDLLYAQTADTDHSGSEQNMQ